MDDQQNQGAPASGPLGGPGPVPPPPPGGMPPSPPPVGGPGGGPGGEDPHTQILTALSRIEAKLAEISAKLGI